MRRRDVSPEELARIIRLRQSDTSWLQIQRDTGVSRRIAKRAFEEWGRSQAREELKAAREHVAAEEFRNHLHCLIKLALSLVNALYIPQPSRHPIPAKEVMLNLWQQNIVGEYGAYGLPGGDGRMVTYPPETCLRQNLILFKSLRAHTHEKVAWQALDKWEDAWDICTKVLNKLQEEASKTLLNTLNQRRKLRETIAGGSRKKDIVERMVDGTLYSVWETILADKPGQLPLAEAILRGDGIADVVFGKGRHNFGLVFTGIDLGKEAADTCIWVAENLISKREEEMIELANNVSTMRKAIDEFTEMLNPLILGPIILRTRCDLCPA